MGRFVDDDRSNWNGVFAVYRLPVEAVIKPSKRLVPDAGHELDAAVEKLKMFNSKIPKPLPIDELHQ
jgi:hypothetical protein